MVQVQNSKIVDGVQQADFSDNVNILTIRQKSKIVYGVHLTSLE